MLVTTLQSLPSLNRSLSHPLTMPLGPTVVALDEAGVLIDELPQGFEPFGQGLGPTPGKLRLLPQLPLGGPGRLPSPHPKLIGHTLQGVTQAVVAPNIEHHPLPNLTAVAVVLDYL